MTSSRCPIKTWVELTPNGWVGYCRVGNTQTFRGACGRPRRADAERVAEHLARCAMQQFGNSKFMSDRDATAFVAKVAREDNDDGMGMLCSQS